MTENVKAMLKKVSDGEAALAKRLAELETRVETKLQTQMDTTLNTRLGKVSIVSRNSHQHVPLFIALDNASSNAPLKCAG